MRVFYSTHFWGKSLSMITYQYLENRVFFFWRKINSGLMGQFLYTAVLHFYVVFESRSDTKYRQINYHICFMVGIPSNKSSIRFKVVKVGVDDLHDMECLEVLPFSYAYFHQVQAEKIDSVKHLLIQNKLNQMRGIFVIFYFQGKCGTLYCFYFCEKRGKNSSKFEYLSFRTMLIP